MPDMDLVSFGEMADAVETCIAAAPNVLWLADGDTGHGNALAVQKVIRTYACRGAAAVLIEDKIWPRPLGHGGAKLVIERVRLQSVYSLRPISSVSRRQR
jgi:2-methylisocitrate lyase-like PEP mutase family enzyme